MFTRLHHVGLLVKDLNETKKLYCDHFGLTPGREFDLVEEDVRILNIPIGNSMIEVNQVINDDSGVGRYLEKNGDGLHHICLESDNLDADLEMLKATRLRPHQAHRLQRLRFPSRVDPPQASAGRPDRTMGKPQRQTRHLPFVTRSWLPVQPVRLGSHYEVVAVQVADLVRPPSHTHLAPLGH